MIMEKQNIDEKEIPTGLELDYLAGALGKRFIRRWDLYSRQRNDGRYVCMHERLQHDHLLQHLQGELTLGTYVLDAEDLGQFIVFDADDGPDWRRLRAVAKSLNEREIPSYLERSRRGGHLWLFFEGPLPGSEIRSFGQALMLHYGLGGIELFPKQSRLTGGPGSLIRLPFGVHQKSGKRYSFYLTNGQPLALTLREQIYLLENPETVPKETVEHLAYATKVIRKQSTGHVPKKQKTETEKTPTPLFKQIKQAISVRDFIGQYVDLSAAGTGLCPFHNDNVESFSVHDERNYWKCFACDKSGSIIDFWMYYRDCDFGTAVDQLAGMLL